MEPTKEEKEMRNDLIEKIKSIVKKIWPNAKVKEFYFHLKN